MRNATGFHRLWSALSFLFCIVDGAGETAVTEQVTLFTFSSFFCVANAAAFVFVDKSTYFYLFAFHI